ncbi:Hha/YmoA family nucleoid-associated regulatory protein [Pantoea sp. AS142]|uniref:Hha/YmoA family nucleoid-associated regulatory protein n=1 Tax=Pantoea sp. AS142 TaxID=3081292 RepID=UPI00301A3219
MEIINSLNSKINWNDMTKTDWLMKFRRCHTLETLETVYENLSYKIPDDEGFAMTQAYDHRKAEFAAGKLFDRVLGYVWRFVK